MDERIERPKLSKHTPFFILLEKTQRTTLYTSYTGDEEDYINKNDGVLKQLQTYVKAGNEDAYNELVNKFPGRIFRRTKGEVYEMFDEGKEIEIRIALQVKAHSLTWYFWKPGVMDQYPQRFRDILYHSAAQAHRKVTNGCDLYYRGSNSVHLKLMHHLEIESLHNHNHYRLKNNQPYTPEDFNQHMEALKETEAFTQFFNVGEIEKIEERFAQFYADWHTKTEGGLSKHEEYMQDPSQRLNTGDVIELMLFGYQQEPCRINVRELTIDYDAARKEIEEALEKGGTSESQLELTQKLQEIEKQYKDLLKYREKGGSRGLLSEIGATRQTYQSEFKPNPYVGGQDSSFGAPPEIPEWATKLKILVEEGKKAMIETRAEREIIEDSQKEEAIKSFEQEVPEHIRSANKQKNMKFFKEETKEETKEDSQDDLLKRLQKK
ncbi:hypothetical protein [Legionella cincinnatiensis]|uniref:Uncharacterized protein n=1 Tax=Legionella cincinnatiensis TaxID=28085 RepID=A0A378IFS0_9GAMM|nr:hypothetical protein [Legionella cincinnatiensis]KTC93603.1 hypothetical protein Lcin_0183 [Legionella cincinnatiensis]STX34067.1 Uncharacterised protein [Legionella cincinnatiensis]